MNMETPRSETAPASDQKETIKARSFDELYVIIRHLGDVQGSRAVITPEELIDTIGCVRNGSLPINFVTRTNGYRSIVEKLLSIERAENGGEWPVLKSDDYDREGEWSVEDSKDK